MARNMIKQGLIAPCGMDCGICMAYLREKNRCPGCNGSDENKSVSCLRCRIKNCVVLKRGKTKFCIDCDKFPCDRLKHLDKRYRTKYGMSMIENLENIKKWGIRKFVRNEKTRWACPECGGVICVHRWCCSKCGKKRE
jgi:hypothetical protein